MNVINEYTIDLKYQGYNKTTENVVRVQQNPTKTCLVFQEYQKVWETMRNPKIFYDTEDMLIENERLATSEKEAYQKCMNQKVCRESIKTLGKLLKMKACFKTDLNPRVVENEPNN